MSELLGECAQRTMATPTVPFTYSGRDQNHTMHTFSVTPGSRGDVLSHGNGGPALVSTNHTSGGFVGGGGQFTDGVAQHEVEVELYAVLVCCLAMVAFGVLGLLSNLALLVSTKCKKSIRHIQFGLPYCLATVNIILCLLWVPLEALRIVLNYCHLGLYPAVCHLGVALFYFCVGTLIFVNVFISIHRILQFLSICLIQSAFIMAGITVSAILGILFAVGVSLDYERTVDFRVCTQTWPSSESRLSIAAVAINTLWVLVLLIICSAMLGVIILQRQRMAQPQHHRVTNSLTKDYVCQKQNEDLEEAKQRFLNSIPEGGNKPIAPSKPKSKLVSEGSRKKLTFGTPSKKDAGSESEGSDDDFDARMKMKLQKSLSGRRHTVANIGLGESSFGGRRGSMETVKSAGGSHHYNYVRKWSVDIVALQDQLENPKAYLTGAASASGALSTLTDKNTSKSQSTSSNKITGSITEENHEEEPSHSSPSTSAGKANNNKEDKGAEKAPAEDAIVVEEAKADQPAAAGDNVANGNPSDHLSVVDSSVNDTVDDDCEPVLDKKEIVQALQVNTVCLVLLLTILACVLPFAFLQFLQVSMATSLNRNLSWVLAALCVIQTPVHTFLIAWMERKLWHGLRRLHVKLTHWKCVCYCNIGKGRKCFERPDRQTNPSC